MPNKNFFQNTETIYDKLVSKFWKKTRQDEHARRRRVRSRLCGVGRNFVEIQRINRVARLERRKLTSAVCKSFRPADVVTTRRHLWQEFIRVCVTRARLLTTSHIIAIIANYAKFPGT